MTTCGQQLMLSTGLYTGYQDNISISSETIDTTGFQSVNN